MKQVHIVFFSLVLGFFAGLPFGARAQTQPGTLPGDVPDITTQPGVAFTETAPNGKSRSLLYIKRPGAPVDVYDIPKLVTQLSTGSYEFDSIRHLAVIGMDPNGKSLVLGGEVFYKDPAGGQASIFSGIFRIPWPLNSANLLNDLPFDGVTDKARWFLKAATDLGNFHPSGILSPDGSQWYATMRTSTQGGETMRFYHGNTDGSGTVDSAIITGEVIGSGGAPADGWNLSNIALDASNGTMLAMSVDGLTSTSNQGQRYLIIHWAPTSQRDPLIHAIDMTQTITQLSIGALFNIDELFAVTVAAPAQDGQSIDIGLKNITDTDGTIEFYTTRYDDPNNLIAAATIPASILPDSTTFFAGPNTSEYQDDNSIFHEHGQSGDVMLTQNGSMALFTTHERPDAGYDVYPKSPRDVKSAIFSYDFNEPTAQLIYNDSSAQELQPVFVSSKDTIPHVPDIIASASTLPFGTVDTASTSAPQTLTITDTSVFDGTIIDSAKIIGDNEFTIVSPTFPVTILHNSNMQSQNTKLQLLFSPVGTAGTRTATLTVYSAMSATKSLAITLNGTAKVQAPNGVKEDASLAQSMTIEPNPFSSIASVQLTARDAGALGIVVQDALGRTVYTSPLQHAGAGAIESFQFDAKSLGLPNGVYYVTALFGNRQVSRQVIFVR